jgi:DNA repair protein RecN (Recombination protein N)
LPQIAAKGSQHFKIYKEIHGDSTSSYVRRLSSEERVNELAVMLSGARPSESALRNAADLLASGQ